MHLLMESAMVANEATECVLRAENEMMIDHPHLLSIYHVLALVIFAEHIAGINERMEKTKLQENSHMALQFVAEVVEIAFYSGGREKFLPSIERFTKKSGLDSKYVEEVARQVNRMTVTETLFEWSETNLSSNETTAHADGKLKSHTWLGAN
jgi:hypothetical protein